MGQLSLRLPQKVYCPKCRRPTRTDRKMKCPSPGCRGVLVPRNNGEARTGEK